MTGFLEEMRALICGNSGDGQATAPELPGPADPVFPGNHIKMFNNILTEEKLIFDRDDNRRTAYRNQGQGLHAPEHGQADRMHEGAGISDTMMKPATIVCTASAYDEL